MARPSARRSTGSAAAGAASSAKGSPASMCHGGRLRLAQRIDAGVVRDAEQPAGEAALRVEGREVAERLDERLLRQILGQGRVPGQPDEQAQDGPLIPAQDLFEGRLGAGQCLRHQPRLRDRLEINRYGEPSASLRGSRADGGAERCPYARSRSGAAFHPAAGDVLDARSCSLPTLVSCSSSVQCLDGVAVITIDNPPVNALSPGVPEGLMDGGRARRDGPARPRDRRDRRRPDVRRGRRHLDPRGGGLGQPAGRPLTCTACSRGSRMPASRS